MTTDFFSSTFKQRLRQQYDAEESAAITNMILMHILNTDRKGLNAIKNVPLEDKTVLKLESILSRLINGEPVQYVLGEVYFYDILFHVNQGVLIPRPETELLVDFVIKENTSRNLKVLDIGTGSGCIAITLKKHLIESTVTATDISDQALNISKINAKTNHCEITFYKHDIVHDKSEDLPGMFDLIVSNPPYVTEKEKVNMHKNVLHFEPYQALFVPDDDPLLFYKAIHLFAKDRLNKNGKIYFEINEGFASDLKKYFINSGFKTVALKKDLAGKDRILIIG